MNPNTTFAHDANLNFPVDEPIWVEFFRKFCVDVRSYLDMAKLTKDMKTHTITCAYIPAGIYYFLREDPYYEPIAHVLFSAGEKTKLASLLIVTKTSNIDSLDELRGKTLGYTHAYCTSSYFGPMLLLWRHSLSIHNFFGKLVEVAAWQKQIDAVISGEIDATMVQEDVWYKDPNNALQTKIIAKQEDLPSPVVLISKEADETFRREFIATLLTYHAEKTSSNLFSGFIPYQKQCLESFFANSENSLAFKSEIDY